MKINLSHRIGINSAQGQQPYLDWWIAANCRQFILNGQWAAVNKAKNVFDYEYLKAPIDRIISAGRNVILGIFSVPAHLYPNMPKVDRITYEAVPYIDKDGVEPLKDYVRLIVGAFPEVETFGCFTETNLMGWWRDPAIDFDPKIGQKQRDFILAEKYMELVVKPISEVLRELGRKLIVGSPTMQGERQNTWDRAIRHVQTIRGKSEGSFDFFDCHIYREIGSETVGDIQRLFRYFAQKGKALKNPLCLSEIGFSEKECFNWWERLWRNLTGAEPYTGQMKQARNFKALLDFVQKIELEYIERKKTDPNAKPLLKLLMFYRSWDPAKNDTGTNGLLKEVLVNGVSTVEAKLSGELVREYLQAA